MRKVSEMYKMYRDLPLFEALEDALVELCSGSAPLPLHLATAVVHSYDRVVVEVARSSPTEYTITGKLAVFRILKEQTWLLLSGAAVLLGGEEEAGEKRRRKREVARCERLLVRCYDPHTDPTLQPAEQAELCPYTVEVEEKLVVRKKKSTFKLKGKKVGSDGGYNPTVHATALGGGPAAGSAAVASWRRPQPYNEKLRRTQTEEERVELAREQVGVAATLKGRYRRRMTEHPHRCIEAPRARRQVDLAVVRGAALATPDRRYSVQLRPADRTIAEWAATAGGCLALAPHNVHVVEEGLGDVREEYATRRRNRIGGLTFDSARSFAVVDSPDTSCSEVSSPSSRGAGAALEHKPHNSFGKYKIPKTPKSVQPCPRSMREVVEQAPGATGGAMGDNLEQGVVIKEEKDLEQFVVIKEERSEVEVKKEEEELVEDLLNSPTKVMDDVDLDFLDDVVLEPKNGPGRDEVIDDESILDMLGSEQG